MSLLPEQKKTPEEIAALRGKLGIPNAEQAQGAAATQVAAGAKSNPEPAPPKPVVTAEPVKLDAASGLPLHRHSEEELADLRRRSMFETQNEALRMPVRRAHVVWVIGGYLLAGVAALPVYLATAIAVPVAMLAAALAIAAFLFFLRPYSRHHGAFISMVVLFVLLYMMFQYFPHLQHAT